MAAMKIFRMEFVWGKKLFTIVIRASSRIQARRALAKRIPDPIKITLVRRDRNREGGGLPSGALDAKEILKEHE